MLKEEIYNIFSEDKNGGRRNSVNKFELCGDYTIELVKQLKPKLVLDLGCGDNQYKGKIPNVIGIDITPKLSADIVGDISDLSQWKDSSADACLCMGSINFGGHNTIEQQISEVYRVLKDRGLCILRGNMNDYNNNIFYGWDLDKISYWTSIFNWNIYHAPEEVRRLKSNGTINRHWKDRRFTNSSRKSRRLFWIWQK